MLQKTESAVQKALLMQTDTLRPLLLLHNSGRRRDAAVLFSPECSRNKQFRLHLVEMFASRARQFFMMHYLQLAVGVKGVTAIQSSTE